MPLLSNSMQALESFVMVTCDVYFINYSVQDYICFNLHKVVDVTKSGTK